MVDKNKIAELEKVVESLTVALSTALRRVELLECLEACGVDNWSGYEDAQDMYNGSWDDYDEE